MIASHHFEQLDLEKAKCEPILRLLIIARFNFLSGLGLHWISLLFIGLPRIAFDCVSLHRVVFHCIAFPFGLGCIALELYSWVTATDILLL